MLWDFQKQQPPRAQNTMIEIVQTTDETYVMSSSISPKTSDYLELVSPNEDM